MIVPLAQWRLGSKVLRPRCGDSVHTRALMRLGFSDYGLETSSEAVAKARPEFPDAEYYDVEAEVFEPPQPLD